MSSSRDERAVLDIVSSLAVHFNDSEGLSNGYRMTYSLSRSKQ